MTKGELAWAAEPRTELVADATAQLRQALKELIVTECCKDFDPASIQDDERLINGRHGFDSLDALEICFAVKAKYGVHITNGMMARRVLKTVATLASHIEAETARQSST